MKKRLLRLITLFIVTALAVTSCGGDGDSAASGDAAGSENGAVASAGDPAEGEELYNQVCIACHGEGGIGIEGLGKPFTTSDFLAAQSDQELLAFIKEGRPVGHPDNTTGVDMPPKGGNPALSDEDILNIIAYLRTLHE